MSLATALAKAAAMHRKSVLAMITSSAETITVVLPEEGGMSGAATMFGDLSETDLLVHDFTPDTDQIVQDQEGGVTGTLGSTSGEDSNDPVIAESPPSWDIAGTGYVALDAPLSASDAEDDKVTVGPFSCLWHNLIVNAVPVSKEGAAIVGRFPSATAYAVVALDTTLVDPSEVEGDTWFDRADYILHRNQMYKVLEARPTGMANVAPYLLQVVVKKEAHARG